MFKKTALIALLCMTSLKAANAPEAGVMETIKNSHGISMWLGAIIPSILSFVSMEFAIRANKDKPDRKDVVAVAKFIRWMSLFVGAYFFDEWFRADFKEFTLNRNA